MHLLIRQPLNGHQLSARFIPLQKLDDIPFSMTSIFLDRFANSVNYTEREIIVFNSSKGHKTRLKSFWWIFVVLGCITIIILIILIIYKRKNRNEITTQEIIDAADLERDLINDDNDKILDPFHNNGDNEMLSVDNPLYNDNNDSSDPFRKDFEETL